MKLKISSQEIAERKITRRWGEKRLAQIVDAIALRRLFFVTSAKDDKGETIQTTDEFDRPILVVRPIGKPVPADGKNYSLEIAPIWCRAFTVYDKNGELNAVTVDFSDHQQEFTEHGSTKGTRRTTGPGCDPKVAEDAQYEIVKLLERTIGKEHMPCPIAKQLNQYLWERFSK